MSPVLPMAAVPFRDSACRSNLIFTAPRGPSSSIRFRLSPVSATFVGATFSSALFNDGARLLLRAVSRCKPFSRLFSTSRRFFRLGLTDHDAVAVQAVAYCCWSANCLGVLRRPSRRRGALSTLNRLALELPFDTFSTRVDVSMGLVGLARSPVRRLRCLVACELRSEQRLFRLFGLRDLKRTSRSRRVRSRAQPRCENLHGPRN